MVSRRKIAVITGTNSNLGLNIAHRLVEQIDDNSRLTIVVTSRTLPRVKEVVGQILEHAGKFGKADKIDFDYLLVDFTDMVSTLGAYYELNKRYKEIHYFFVNAAQGVYDGIDWLGAIKEVFTSPIEAVTNPSYKIQRVGVKSKDGLGLVFQANVFGPYYLIQKILPQLSAGRAVVVWISSIMSDPKYLSLNDMQLLETSASYEGSKRLVDLVQLATYKEMKKRGINQYVVHPGIFISHSFFKYLNFFTYYGMLFLFYLARYLGSPWHNIDGYRAANAPVYVATLANSNFENQEVKFGSATYKEGLEYIKTTPIDPTGVNDVHKYFQELEQEWDKKLENQITNSRQVD
ncbi:LAMI_0H16182g1_1 [Lachancea mirantina]|uniref:3beta-hydroxysteroid 3-dehydrogenase n=1 Tax=Lachancea mirantina TaxID=1230905 RepID=A0A1G4KIW9_9SACH|nr:LAMI_0H16182g1_1 [Lachancea mirantina]